MIQCGHNACTCEVDRALAFCGPTCRMGIGDTGEPCKCGHAECSETTGNASLAST